MTVLAVAVAWFVGVATSWAFFRGAELARRRDDLLRGEVPGIGEDCSGDWDYDCETGFRQR